MTQEDKDLLLKDLCARLPYGVILNCCNIVGEKLYTIDSNGLVNNDYDLEEVKPYLFPLSSMTDEQIMQAPNSILVSDLENLRYVNGLTELESPATDLIDLIDWLNKNHFDYRGLIEKSLALDATKLNIY